MTVTVPDALTWFRIVTSPALVALAWFGGTGWVVGFLLLLQVTDLVDGPLARGLRQKTTAGARLDSLADVLMFGSLLGALAVLEGPLLRDAWPWIAAAVGSYAASSAYAMARFRRMPTYHQWTAKVSGPITVVAALVVLLFGEGWPVRVAAAAVTLGNLEGALITSRLTEPRTDVPSVFALLGTGRARLMSRRLLYAAASVVVLALGFWFVVIPYPMGLASGDPGMTSVMEQRVREARAAGDSLVIRREWADLDEISTNVRRAVVVAEDYRFREHEGVDWVSLAEEVQWTGDEDFSWWSPADLRALAGALVYAWENRSELRGRSTITQQLAKNLYFGTDRSLARKAMEMVVAKRLERHLEKDRILELYLNAAEWGPGVFGVEAAARSYFGRSAADVGLAQAAALAATLPHPLTSNPAHRPSRMAWRRDLILSRLRPGASAAPAPIPEPPPELVVPGPDSAVSPDTALATPPDTVAPDTIPAAPLDTLPGVVPDTIVSRPPGGGA